MDIPFANLTLVPLFLTFLLMCQPSLACVKAVQIDNGREFDNSSACNLVLTRGILFRMSCHYMFKMVKLNGFSLSHLTRCLPCWLQFLLQKLPSLPRWCLPVSPHSHVRATAPHLATDGDQRCPKFRLPLSRTCGPSFFARLPVRTASAPSTAP